MAADPERQPLRPQCDERDISCDHHRSASDEEAAAKAEGNSWIVMTSLLVLSIGLCLEAYRFMNVSASKTLPSQLFILDEFEGIEVFDIACMSISVLWIFVTLGRYCYFQEHDKSRRVHIGNYLIYGLAFFALGGMFLGILETMLFFSYECASATGRAYVLAKIFYIVAQVVFIFFSRYRNIFDRSLINGVFLFHTIVTNMIMYLRTFLVSKINTDNHHNHTTCNCSGVGLNLTTQADDLDKLCKVRDGDILHAYKGTNEYFSPFCLEFALTASALLAELWLEQSHSTDTDTQNGSSSGQSGAKELLGSVTSASVFGLFIFGSFVFMLILDVEINGEQQAFYIYRVVVVSLMILICFIGLLSLEWNTQIGNSLGLDEFLVYVPLFGVFLINMLQVIAAWSSLYSEKIEAKHARGYAKVVIVDGFGWCFQASLQAAFITKALHRAPRNIKLANTSSLAVVLIFCNLGVWLMDTVVLDEIVQVYKLPELMYGEEAWMWVRIIVYPLVVFYRIHCVFTFYSVFNAHRTLT